MSHFKVADRVRRRRGTLGADGSEGLVIETSIRNGFDIVTVRFPDRTEKFHWDVYELVSPADRGGAA